MFYRLNVTTVGKCWLVVHTSKWAMQEHRHAAKFPILTCFQVFLTHFNRSRQRKTKAEIAKGLPILKIQVIRHIKGDSQTTFLWVAVVFPKGWILHGLLVSFSSYISEFLSLLHFCDQQHLRSSFPCYHSASEMDNKHWTDNIKSISRFSSGIILISLAYEHGKSLVLFPLSLFLDDRAWQIFSF